MNPWPARAIATALAGLVFFQAGYSLGGPAASPSDQDPPRAAVEAARSFRDRFGQAHQAALKIGQDQASVCRRIEEMLREAARPGVTLSLTASRPLNRKYRGDEIDRGALFALHKAGSQGVEELYFIHRSQETGRRVGRYYLRLPAGRDCRTCHRMDVSRMVRFWRAVRALVHPDEPKPLPWGEIIGLVRVEYPIE